jgi:hypothetical protein
MKTRYVSCYSRLDYYLMTTYEIWPHQYKRKINLLLFHIVKVESRLQNPNFMFWKIVPFYKLIKP